MAKDIRPPQSCELPSTAPHPPPPPSLPCPNTRTALLFLDMTEQFVSYFIALIEQTKIVNNFVIQLHLRNKMYTWSDKKRQYRRENYHFVIAVVNCFT